MDIQTSIEQVAGILVREGLSFQTHEDGDGYRLWFGDDAVFIHFDRYGDGTRVYLTSPVLQDLDPEDAGYAVLLNALNELNATHRFTKFFVHERTSLLAVQDLFGDDLRAPVLINAIYTLVAAVAEVAAEYGDATGGLRYAEFVGEPELEEVDEDL
jgi:hypothetical protein